MHFYLNWAKERIDEMKAALGVFAGSIARYRAAPEAWEDAERQLIVEALASEPDPTAAFRKASNEAARLIA